MGILVWGLGCILAHWLFDLHFYLWLVSVAIRTDLLGKHYEEHSLFFNLMLIF